ncbi:MAG: hypothetical protein WCJ07_06780 [Verrucomicrobiota bacterium]
MKHTSTFTLFIALLLAPLAADAAALAKAVEELPAASVDQKLKKAVLQWALEDARASQEVGQVDQADAVLKDVERLLPESIGLPQPAPENLFPPIPKPKDNPYGQAAVKTFETLIAANELFPKGKDTAHVMTERGWKYPRLSSEGLELARAFCHPQSPLAADARLIAPLLRRFAEIYRSLTPGSKDLADFGCSDSLAEMYLLVRTRYPDLIPPSRQAVWEHAIMVNAEAILAQKGATFAAGKTGTGYPNADFKLINGLLFASLVLDRADFRKAAENGMRLMETCIYPDGGFCYISTQNEVFTYHYANIHAAARYWQVTGNELAKSLIVRSRWYYPLSTEPGDVAEYATATSWKHYWNTASGSDSAVIVAGITGDAQNLRIARSGHPKGDLFLATFYRDDITPASAKNNYIVHDRNIQGARGRFGAFSFVATARNLLDDNRGKSTYVGCMVLEKTNSGNNRWPLSAALDSIGSEVRVKPLDPAKSGPGKSTTMDSGLFSLSQQERNAALTSRDFAAITTTHALSGYKTAPISWEGRQEWLLTSERLIGLVSLRSLADQKAYALRGCINLVSGRAIWGVKKEFQRPTAETLRYGALTTKIHAHDYAGITAEYTDVMGLGPGKTGRIVLLDQAAQDAEQRTPVSYPKGTEHFYLVEIRPESSSAAGVVSKLALANGLVGIELTENGRTLRLIHNPKSTPATYRDQLAWLGTIQLHRSGEEYRPAWIGEDGREEHANPPSLIARGDVKIEIPAGAHIVLENQSEKPKP